MLASARCFVRAALIACLGAVWTCPAYCAHMSTASDEAPPPVEVAMTGHQHHHMSSPTNNASAHDGGAAFQSARRDCCGNCGTSDQALLSAAKPETSSWKTGDVA